MGLLVVDASAIAAVIFAEDDRLSVAQRLGGQFVIAPSLIVYELVNIALKKCKSGLLTPDQAASSLAEFFHFKVELHETDMEPCLRVALRHKLAAYDGSYLHLCRVNQAELVTLDRRLSRAASDA